MLTSRKTSPIQHVAIYAFARDEDSLSDGKQVDLCSTAGKTLGFTQFSCYIDVPGRHLSEFERLLSAIEGRHVRAILVASLDCFDPLRLARLLTATKPRSLQDQVPLYIIQQGLDTSTPPATLALQTVAAARVYLRDAPSLSALAQPATRVEERGSTSLVQQIYQQIVQSQPCSIDFLELKSGWHRRLVEACVEILRESGVVERQAIATVGGAVPGVRCVGVERHTVSIQGNVYPRPLLSLPPQDVQEGGAIVFGVVGDPTRYAVERGEQGYTELLALVREQEGGHRDDEYGGEA
jgi:hypothetical protein